MARIKAGDVKAAHDEYARAVQYSGCQENDYGVTRAWQKHRDVWAAYEIQQGHLVNCVGRKVKG